MLSLNLLAKRTKLSDTISGDSGTLHDIYYHELDSSTPGVCVVSDDGKLTWSPVKITRSCVKDAASDHDSESAKDSSSDSEDLKPSQIATMDFESRSGVPGFEIETHDDDAFWVPVAFRTRARLKTYASKL